MQTFIISKHSMELLNNYYSSKTKGDDLEKVAKEILKTMKYEYSEIEYEMANFQYRHGDLIVMNRDYSLKSIDVKASHSFRNIDKLALDIEYFKKGTKEPYIPTNAIDNKGYTYHLLSDTVMAINPISKKLYVINNFQKFRKQLLELIEDYNKDFEILSILGIEMSINKGDYNKDSLVANVDFKSMKILKADIKEYKLEEEWNLRTLDYNNKFEYDILNSNKKNTSESPNTEAFK